jgi:hypothetical protein
MTSKAHPKLRGRWARGILFVFVFSIASLFVKIISSSGADNMLTKAPVELRIGEPGESFIQRNPKIAEVDRQAAGLNFYELNWSTRHMGSVVVKQESLRFPIDHVISVTSTEDMEYKSEGISEIKIHSALTSSPLISHDEARLKLFALLTRIHEAGWKTTIPRTMARVRGKDMNTYLLQTRDYTTLDPAYVPSLEEWMQYRDLTSWAFYAGHVYLTVQITREHTLIDPSKPGAYLVSTCLQNEPEHFRRYVDGLQRPHWKRLMMAEIAQAAKSRAEVESMLRAQGVQIDENYVDPPLPDLSTR